MALVLSACAPKEMASNDGGLSPSDAGSEPMGDGGAVDSGTELFDAGVTDGGRGDGGSDGGASDGGQNDGGSDDPCALPSFGSGFQLVSASSRPSNVARFQMPPFAVTTVYPRSPTTLDVFFSRPVVPASGLDTSHYGVAPTLNLTGATDGGAGSIVSVFTAPQVKGQAYSLTVTGVQAAAGGTFPTAVLPFTGYQSSMNAIGAGPSADPKVITLIFSEAVQCAPLAAAANFTVDGQPVVSTAYFGACTTTTQNLKLNLSRGLAPGAHLVAASANVVTKAGSPLDVPTVTVFGPSSPSPFFVQRLVTTADTGLTVTFNDAPGVEALDAGSYTITPSLQVASVAPVGNSTSVQLTTSPMTANTVYTLEAHGIGPSGLTPLASLPNAYFWGADSFYVANSFSLFQHSGQVQFSTPVGVNAGLWSSYSIQPAVNGSVQGVGLFARFTFSDDVDGQEYAVTVANTVTSATGVSLVPGHAGFVDLVLSQPLSSTAPAPHVYLEGADLSVNHYLTTSADRLTLGIETGPLPSGTYALKVCNVTNEAGTARIGESMINVVVP